MLSVANREPEPLIVNEFDGFEGVARAMVLGNIISCSRGSSTVPLGGPLDVSWEIVLLPLSYREGEVSVEDYCDFFGDSHDVLLRWCGGGSLTSCVRGRRWLGACTYVKFRRELGVRTTCTGG